MSGSSGTSSQNTIVVEVPREVIVVHFGGVAAMSPELFGSALAELAAEYKIDSVEALREYVFEVLRSLSCPLD